MYLSEFFLPFTHVFIRMNFASWTIKCYCIVLYIQPLITSVPDNGLYRTNMAYRLTLATHLHGKKQVHRQRVLWVLKVSPH